MGTFAVNQDEGGRINCENSGKQHYKMKAEKFSKIKISMSNIMNESYLIVTLKLEWLDIWIFEAIWSEEIFLWF